MTELTPKNFGSLCPLLKRGFRVTRPTNSSVVIQNDTLKTGTAIEVTKGLGMRDVTGYDMANQAISTVCNICDHHDGSLWMALRVAKGKCDPKAENNNTATITARIGV